MPDREKFADLDPTKIIAEMRDEYWRGLAQADRETVENRVQVLLMEVAGERFALDVDHCRTITRAGRLTRLPRMPAFVLGVMNLRGEIVSVVDLGLLFNLGAREPGPKSRLVVIESGKSRIAVLADRVLGIEWIDAARIREPQTVSASLKSEYVKGNVEPLPDEPWIVYLNVVKLLEGPELSFKR
jgi:purine-binding chemotaxis protein CheW